MVETVDWVVRGHHFYAGVYAKECIIPRGIMLVSHKHNYDHMSILALGRVQVVVDGVTNVYEGPCIVPIAAGKEHNVLALESAVWFCIHPTDETCDPSRVDAAVIMKE